MLEFMSFLSLTPASLPGTADLFHQAELQSPGMALRRDYSSALVFATTTRRTEEFYGQRNKSNFNSHSKGKSNSNYSPGATATPTPTRTVTPTPTPTPTIPAGNTVFALTIGLDGLGSTGDNANPGNSSGSNKNPKRPSRNIKIEVFDGRGNPVAIIRHACLPDRQR